MELAIFSDCQKLIENFIINNKQDFDEFCKIWKSMSFQHMFSLQTSMIEILQTTTAIFHLAKRTACGRKITGQPLDSGSDHKKQQLKRLAGIYLMYVTYFKQPTKQFVKIELSLKSWQELKNFVTSIQHEIEEAAFILWKLKIHNAFRFTAVDYYLALDNLVDYDHLDKYDHISDSIHDTLECDLPAIYELKNVSSQFGMLEEKYNEMKKELARQENAISANSLPTTNVFQNIHKIIERLTTPNQHNMQPIAERSTIARREIKRKAKAFEAASQDTELSASDAEYDNEANINKTKIYRRMSANTVFAQPLTQNVLNDLQLNTDSDTSE